MMPRNFWGDKRVLITGGHGFIGSHLVKKLKSVGAKILVVNHHGCVDGVEADLTNFNQAMNLKSQLAEYHPDIVFHLAAQPIVNYAAERLMETLNTNIVGTYHLLHVCAGVPSIQSIVHISTDKVYGNIPLITGNLIANGVEHPYNASKLAGDIMARMFLHTFEMPITIVRHGNVYGAGDKHLERIVPNTCYRVWNNRPPIIRGDGKALRDYIHVDDIVVGYLRIAEREYGEGGAIYNLGSKEPTSVLDVVDTVLKVTKRIDLAPRFSEMLAGEIPNQHIIDTVSAQKIDWSPRIDLETGIELTAEYYRNFDHDK